MFLLCREPFLGPILFHCFINDLPNASNLITNLFADDTQGLAVGKKTFLSLYGQSKHLENGHNVSV